MKNPSESQAVVDSYTLSDIVEATANRRRMESGFVSLSEAREFDYPTFFTSIFDYFATGEGSSIGIVMGYVQSPEQLNRMVLEHFGPYYASGAELWPRLHLPPTVKKLIPVAIRTVISDPTQVIGNFYYTSRFHLNQS